MNRKKKYQMDPRKKISAGKPWRIMLEIDPDNAQSVLNEIDKSPTGGTYEKVINNRIRLGYK